jgi:hypothetical protein
MGSFRILTMDLRFSQQWLWRLLSSWLHCCVFWWRESNTEEQNKRSSWLLSASWLFSFLSYSLTTKMEVVCSSETSVDYTASYPRRKDPLHQNNYVVFCLKLKCLTCSIIFTFTVKISIPDFLGDNFCYAICCLIVFMLVKAVSVSFQDNLCTKVAFCKQ